MQYSYCKILKSVFVVILISMLKIFGVVLLFVGFMATVTLLIFREPLRQFVPFYSIYLVWLLSFLGAKLFNYGRRLGIPSAADVLLRDQRRPIIYLRPFKEDRITSKRPELVTAIFGWVGLATEEEQLAYVMNDIGPFITIGRPGELLPQLGAVRIYVNHDEWQDKVTQMMHNARAVIIRLGQSDSLKWEIEKAFEILQPEQLLYLVSENEMDNFRLREPNHISVGMIGGFQYFSKEWEPHWINLKEIDMDRRTCIRTKAPVLKMALRPVFEQLSVPWNPPPITLLNPVAVSIMTLIAYIVIMIASPYILSYLKN